MRLIAALLALVAGAAFSRADAQQSALLASWTQVGAQGAVFARAITRGACPSVTIDGRMEPMRTRAAPTAAFDVRSCEVSLPSTARSVVLAGRRLPLPPAHLRTIAVLGDTGCRIEIIFFQACSDPNKWPFPKIAAQIAAQKPDLIVHAGDYYYRETACLVPVCAGSPHGDNWAVWSADFFAPAAPMLEAAPLLAVRGNHEDCVRGGLGWDRFLDPYPFGPCREHEQAYLARVGGRSFFVLDSSSALDSRPNRLVPLFRADFAALREERASDIWLLTHRPMWGIDATLTGRTLAINRTLEAAEGNPRDLPIALVLSGHIHLFEALRFSDSRSPQIVVGTGGDTLSTLPGRIQNVRIDGTTVASGTAWYGFGFAIFRLDTRTFDVYNRAGAKVFACGYGAGNVSCRRLSG